MNKTLRMCYNALERGRKGVEVGELDKKISLREERDRLLEILRVLPDIPENAEALRLLKTRLDTIQECLEQ